MRNSEVTAGCLIVSFQALIILFAAWIGNVLVGYNLEVWFGYFLWEEVNILLRLLMGIIAVSAAIPLAVIAFILSLVFGAPLLV